MDDVKKAYAWQEAIDLSKQLVAVCEEFSDADTNVLVWHVRQAVVDIPAGVASDLQANRSAMMEPMVKLASALELVRRIYPGIETGTAEERFERLWQRMASNKFNEHEPQPEAESENSDAEEATGAEVRVADNDSQPAATEVPLASLDPAPVKGQKK
jgi:hypothetical protein